MEKGVMVSLHSGAISIEQTDRLNVYTAWS